MTFIGALLALIFAILKLANVDAHFDLIAWGLLAVSLGIVLDGLRGIYRTNGPRVGP